MTSTSKKTWNIYTISFIAVMAALIYVITMFRFPLLGSKVHFANAVCLLAGLLLGPVPGGVAAGLGSALYDALNGKGDYGLKLFHREKSRWSPAAGPDLA